MRKNNSNKHGVDKIGDDVLDEFMSDLNFYYTDFSRSEAGNTTGTIN